jgi:hypothetical protein
VNQFKHPVALTDWLKSKLLVCGGLRFGIRRYCTGKLNVHSIIEVLEWAKIGILVVSLIHNLGLGAEKKENILYHTDT